MPAISARRFNNWTSSWSMRSICSLKAARLVGRWGWDDFECEVAGGSFEPGPGALRGEDFRFITRLLVR
jgi:hypothetical protein